MAEIQKKYDAGYPEMQPEFLWWTGDTYADNYGTIRGQSLEPFKTLQSRGMDSSGESDCPPNREGHAWTATLTRSPPSRSKI